MTTWTRWRAAAALFPAAIVLTACSGTPDVSDISAPSQPAMTAPASTAAGQAPAAATSAPDAQAELSKRLVAAVSKAGAATADPKNGVANGKALAAALQTAGFAKAANVRSATADQLTGLTWSYAAGVVSAAAPFSGGVCRASVKVTNAPLVYDGAVTCDQAPATPDAASASAASTSAASASAAPAASPATSAGQDPAQASPGPTSAASADAVAAATKTIDSLLAAANARFAAPTSTPPTFNDAFRAAAADAKMTELTVAVLQAPAAELKAGDAAFAVVNVSEEYLVRVVVDDAGTVTACTSTVTPTLPANTPPLVHGTVTCS